MYRLVTFCSLTCFAFAPWQAVEGQGNPASTALHAFADGIGDLTFASAEWVEAADEALGAVVSRHAQGLQDLGEFTICTVAHNPPAYLRIDGPLAFNIKFDGARGTVHAGELPTDQCDLKVQGDHSMLSNLAHIQYHDRDPAVVAAAQARFRKLSRWQVHGSMADHSVLKAAMRTFHDVMAARTMPRLVWATPEWVSLARYIVCDRARNPELNEGLEDAVYTFSEVFYDPPRYASPDGTAGGFWVRCDHGEISVGAGPLPTELEPADRQSRGPYVPILPLGRTVNAAMTDEDQAEFAAFRSAAFADFKPPESERHVTPATNKPFPAALRRCMSVLHDELSKRTSGELPSDYSRYVKPEWARPQGFDRNDSYDASWVNYDQFDIYGNPLR